MEWKDVIAKAPTGTGKTFAFGIPMIAHIDPASEEVQALILAPTRELALQIGDELRGLLTHYENIRVAVLYGGQKLEPQFALLKKKPQIVVATPGRLMDHYKRHTLRLDKVRTVILDEADRMLDMGFFKDVTGIVQKTVNRRNLGPVMVGVADDEHLGQVRIGVGLEVLGLDDLGLEEGEGGEAPAGAAVGLVLHRGDGEFLDGGELVVTGPDKGRGRLARLRGSTQCEEGRCDEKDRFFHINGV